MRVRHKILAAREDLMDASAKPKDSLWLRTGLLCGEEIKP